jgi:NAD(P)-dependent dehydrogenase (short-subunit alcohol dehydrogenase family)
MNMHAPLAAGSAAPSLEGKVSLITGSTGGIGLGIARALAAAGSAIVLNGFGRPEDIVETRARMISEFRVEVAHSPADMSNGSAIARMMATTLEAFGRLDVLFNNAGTGAPPVPLEDLTYEQWKTVVDINLTGVFLCTQEAFKIMKNQDPRGGRIINNGSISAHAPRPNSSPYTSTKHGVTGLTKAASLDGRKYGIACGQIDIGNAATDMTARMKKGVAQANGTVAVEPTMDVENVARAVAYMASLPLDANVLFMTVMATEMPFVGRG